MNDYGNIVPNGRTVTRAIARSRSVRASVARRRRRRIALAACLAAVAGAPVAWWMAEPAAAVAAAAASEVQDLAQMFGKRSPGARTDDQLTKHARVASKVREHPKTVAPAGHPVEPGVPSLVDLLQPPPPSPVEVASFESPFTPPATLGAIINFAPVIPPPGGGGQAHLPASEPREDLPPTSAVPEPGTWAMMLAGFGLIAWRVRRRRDRSIRESAQAR